nr:glycosyltransferase family 2 protein [Halotalea alkalilenta]
MVYIVILNWQGAQDTIACLRSLFAMSGQRFRLLVCDNRSQDDSYEVIKRWFEAQAPDDRMQLSLLELSAQEASRHVVDERESCLYLIQTGANLGFAGGNNVGIRMALNQPDMEYVWLLNNDTEVAPDCLSKMVERCREDPSIGICGAKLVYAHDRGKLQGLGGCYNPWLCTTRHYEAWSPSEGHYDRALVEDQIDYVIGASMLLSRSLLEQVGMLREDYFLYYEELDLCLRAKGRFRLGVSLDSVVYHKEGASTASGTSALSDYYIVRNRLKLTRRFHPLRLPIVWASLFLVWLNRLRRGEYAKARVVARIIVKGR